MEVDEADDSLSDDEDEGGVKTIPETAREYEEDEAAADKSEPPNITGVEIKVTSGSLKSSREGRLELGDFGEGPSQIDDNLMDGDTVEKKAEAVSYTHLRAHET